MKTFTTHSLTVSPAKTSLPTADPVEAEPQIGTILPGYAELPARMTESDVILIKDKHLPAEPASRLIVLVPPGEFDETALARRVWQLAASSWVDVLYLALSPDETQIPYQRLRLANLAALTSGLHVHAHSSLSSEATWEDALRNTLQPGDLIVCLAGQQVSRHFFKRMGLGEYLSEKLELPVYVLGSFNIIRAPHLKPVFREGLNWVIFLLLIAAFFKVQETIQRATAEPLATILLCFTVVVELFLLLNINDWIG